MCARVIEDAGSDVFAAYSTRAIWSGTGTPDCDRVRGSSQWRATRPDVAMLVPRAPCRGWDAAPVWLSDRAHRGHACRRPASQAASLLLTPAAPEPSTIPPASPGLGLQEQRDHFREEPDGEHQTRKPQPPQDPADLSSYAHERIIPPRSWPCHRPGPPPTHPSSPNSVRRPIRPVRPFLRRGTQVDVRAIGTDGQELAEQAVAAYVAKRATKAAESTGTLDRRVGELAELDKRPELPDHTRRLIRACHALDGHYPKAPTLSTRSLQAVHFCLNRAVKRAMARDKVKRNVVELCSVPRGQAGRRAAAAPAHRGVAFGPARRGHEDSEVPARCVEVLWQQFEDQGWERLAADDKGEEHGLVVSSAVGKPLDATNVRRAFRQAL